MGYISETIKKNRIMSNIFYSVNKILQANVKKKVSYKMLYTTKNIQLVQGYPNICREYFRKKFH